MKGIRRGAVGCLRSLTCFPVASLLLAAAIVAMPAHAAAPKRDKDETRVTAQMQPATDIKASALQQMAVLRSIKTNKSATQHKIDSRLFMGILNARDDQRARALPDFRFVRPESDGQIKVEIILSGSSGMKRLLTELERVEAQVDWRSSARTHLLARVPLLAVEEIAALAEVRRVRLPMPAMTNAINTSEGDLTHGAEAARNVYGVSGAGVKVCVLSDGVDSLATLQGSDDLPAVDVLPGQAGSGDEGSAMLEIIHDLAPDAILGFATALPSEAQFAQNILDLAADGCNIIVDDIIYLAESPFQDGPVAQAVNTVTAGGVLYFSSAGNEGNKDDNTSGTWEGDFVPNGTPASLAGAGPVHNFGDGGQSVLVEFGSSATPAILIWAEHYDQTTGLASTDYDLFDMNATLTTVFDASTDVQDGAGGDDFPIEFIGGGAFSGERLVVAQAAAGATSSVPMFNLILFRGELDDNLSTGGTTRGHSAAVEAYSVAATPAAASSDGVSGDGPFPGLFTTADTSESFSADGPRRIILDPTGAELTPGNRTSTGGVVRQKPDITAADGVATASPGFNPFYGTSAAAPHAAAIAALLKQGDPAATPAQIRTALISTALDIEVAGVDSTTGAGIIMPAPALQTLGVAPAAFLADGAAVPTQIVGDGDAFIEGNEDWSLVIPLENVGGVPATEISATLSSSTPGVTVLSATSTYPDLAIAASAPNDTAYTFYVDPSVTCGGLIEFNLDVTYTGGGAPSQTFMQEFQAGSPGAPVTTSYAGAPVGIPDGADLSGTLPGAPVDAVIAVADTGPIYRIAMSIDGDTCNATIGSTTVGIEHTFVNDLELTLLSPAGTAALAINNTDGSGNNFCQTVLDEDGGGTNIQTVITVNAPFSGSFVPNASFAPFRGEDMTGDWTLRAQDFFSGDTGNIRAWSVTVTPAICDAPVQTVQLAATKTVAGTFEEGGAITYTVEITNTGTGLQPDSIGDEFTDTLPAGLTLGTPTATDGTVSAAGVNPVTWNGSLLPGATVTITIPATIDAGTAAQIIANQGTVNFDADRDGTNESVALSDDPGVGGGSDPTEFTVLQGELSITPTAIGFGDVVVGDTSAAQAVTLVNIGAASLDVTSIDAAAAPFALDASGDCPAAPFALAAGTSCTLAYTFSPAVTGAAAASIAVAANAPGGGDIDLTGTGTQGNLTITPAVLAFGNVAVGSTSAASAVTLFNDGDASLEVTTLDPATAPFALDAASTCAAVPFTLAPGTGCDLAYTFAPTVGGAAAETIAVTADAPGGGSFDLSGVGTLGLLVITPTTIDFGDIPVGTVSASEAVELRNTGDAALQVVSFDDPALPFVRTAFGDCPASVPFALAPGASCVALYQFQPTAAGLVSETMTVGDSNGGSAGFTLSGTGTLGQLAVAPTVLAFGDIEVGDTSAPQQITLSNPGNGDTSINGIAGPTAPFARTAGGTCPAGAFLLAAGDSCTAQFTFSPTASGAANQSFTVVAADTDIPSIDVAVSGTGFTIGAVLSGAIDFGEVGVGEGGFVTEQGVSISNTGGVPVEVTAFGDASAPFYYAGTTCDALPFTLQPGESCIVGYGFSPTEAGEFSQALTFATEFGDLQVELSGIGAGTVAPPAVPQPLNIPMLSNLGLLLTIALLALVGLFGIRRQS